MHRFRPLCAALAVLALASDAAAAAPPAVGQLVSGTIVPGFQAVQAATRVQDQAWKGFCAARTSADPKALRDAYDGLSDAWAKIEFMRAGPAESELRVERFNYWLDREGATGRALTAMLAGTDAQSLDLQHLKAGSVAGQGLPVLERLLYGKDAAALQAPGADGDRRCAIGMAMAASLDALADEILAGWTAPDGAAAAIAADHHWGVTFANADEASRVLLTDLVGGLDNLKDSKVALAYHDQANAGAVQLAENARSGRGLRDAMINFAAIRQAIDLYMAPATAEQKKTLGDAFDAADASLKAAMEAQAHSEPHSDARQATLKAAVAALTTLQQTAMTVVPAGSGVSLGFNNLDGD
jgi:hypothetical protein